MPVVEVQYTLLFVQLLQCLYLIMFKNLNSQSALGQGYVSASAAIATGGTLTSGMLAGDPSDSTKQVKFLGIEDFWGNIWEWIDGLTTDNNFNIITNWDYDSNNYNNDFTTSSGLTTNSWGYVTGVAGTTESGFMNIKYGGSASTYFCDYGYLYSGRVLTFGGHWGSGSRCGPFYLDAFYTASTANAAIGARLMYL